MTVKGKGMPFHKKSWEFGNLFIMFKIIFPQTVTAEQQNVARACLSEMDGQQPSGAPQAQTAATSEVKTMLPFEEGQRNTHVQGGTKAQDADDEEQYEEGPQCA